MWLELPMLAVLVAHIWGTAIGEGGWRRFAPRFAAIAAASWLAEDTCIRLYDFYHYAPEWSVFVDKMPLMVMLIWPSVILSARALARTALGDEHGWVPLLTGAFVLADAWLIEPIAVASGLWSWHEPGLFGVPPIGVLGWSIFSVGAAAVLQRLDRGALGLRGALGAILLGVPVWTHAVLLALWWGGFRWMNHTVPSWGAVVVVWMLAVSAGVAMRRLGWHERVAFGTLVQRVPAALFFFVLLGLNAPSNVALIAWSVAFAPLYMALMRWPGGARSARAE